MHGQTAMKTPVKKKAAGGGAKPRAGNSGRAVDAVFAAYPGPVKAKLLALRRLIFDTAKATKGVGALEETLKWGQPSYLTPESKSGSTIRIDQVKAEAGRYAVYFHCQTDLVETFRELYPNLQLRGQPQHPARCRRKTSRSRIAPLRGAGADVSSEEAEDGAGEVTALPSLRGAKRRSNPCLSEPRYGLLRGACHRARIRATRWLAMTAV